MNRSATRSAALSACLRLVLKDRELVLRLSGRLLFVEQLLSQDVCVPAMLSELAQHVEVHPAQRERAAPVAVDHVVQFQG